ncbi:MAG: NAD-dependent epimerase/dehydratase family protein, partial [Pseudomonadota bacterium]
NPINPYGYTKLTVERMLSDMADAHGIKFAALRYFNAAGADRKGRIGERHDPEPHLIPNVIRAAQGKQDAVQIFGQDYPTPDGTAVRDFIHVDDLAEFHLRAMAHVDRSNSNITANLGTGTGYSVRQIVDAVSEIAGTTTPAVDQPRRPGDPPALVASPERAQELLVYSARHSDLPTILRTAWDWHERE